MAKRWTKAERAAFAARMAAARAAKGRGGKQPAKRNPPVKRKAKAKARRNPPVFSRSVGKRALTAAAGGVLAYAGAAILAKIMPANKVLNDFGAILIPAGVGLLVGAAKHPDAGTAAAGAFGAAGLELAQGAVALLAKQNPPWGPELWDNPPVADERLISGRLPSAWTSPRF